jgi:hypothetical protein
VKQERYFLFFKTQKTQTGILRVPTATFSRELMLSNSVVELLLDYSISPSQLTSVKGTTEELANHVDCLLRMIEQMKTDLLKEARLRAGANKGKVEELGARHLGCYTVFPENVQGVVIVNDNQQQQRRLLSKPENNPIDTFLLEERRRLSRRISLLVVSIFLRKKTLCFLISSKKRLDQLEVGKRLF